ncbi:MAG: DedA family protein [Chloroflexi bacterium]|nr:DedA family protein [Chloroflexota bacterium]
MELITFFVDFILHLDEHLSTIISQYGAWTYGILFFIIFMETGFVVTPFLPGDSLLFAAGSFAALGALSPWMLIGLLCIAAILGDTINYWIGHYIGDRAFSGNIRWLKQEYLDKTQKFYEKHGGKTIILARFVPIIRTFAPFVAGVGTMSYGKFISYNIIGGIVWVNLFILMGYFFGNLPFVKKNFELVIFAIIFISLIPPVMEYFKARKEIKAEAEM